MPINSFKRNNFRSSQYINNNLSDILKLEMITPANKWLTSTTVRNIILSMKG